MSLPGILISAALLAIYPMFMNLRQMAIMKGRIQLNLLVLVQLRNFLI